MGDTRQKIQLELAFMSGGRGEARAPEHEGTESTMATREPERPAGNRELMEGVCEATNLRRALRRVKSNGGSPGIDGMTVKELPGYLLGNWDRIRRDLLEGRYRPKPVKRVEIEKPDGGTRKLGIPTVVDRFVQQAVLQVLNREWDGSFSAHSHGFRENHSAHGAVAQAQGYIREGRGWVVDIDLEKFFDRVNHDRLMARLATRTTDRRMLRLIRSFLTAGVLEGGLVSATGQGTPQGGPLSPLLSNIVLDELDQELERRGHKFVRYADDCNIYVKSRRAGERVLKSLRHFLTRQLRLTINEAKSAVDKPSQRKFLGFSFTDKEAKRKIAPRSLTRFKEKIRDLTRRTCGRSFEQVLASVNAYLRGWGGYYGFAETLSVFKELDAWIRRRLRALLWAQWKTRRQRDRQLRKLGIEPDTARGLAGTRHGPWVISNLRTLTRALPVAYFDALHLTRLYGTAA